MKFTREIIYTFFFMDDMTSLLIKIRNVRCRQFPGGLFGAESFLFPTIYITYFRVHNLRFLLFKAKKTKEFEGLAIDDTLLDGQQKPDIIQSIL